MSSYRIVFNSTKRLFGRDRETIHYSTPPGKRLRLIRPHFQDCNESRTKCRKTELLKLALGKLRVLKVIRAKQFVFIKKKRLSRTVFEGI